MSRSRSSGKTSPKYAHIVESLQRKRGIRDANERILVVCEDGASAVTYFNLLRIHLRLTATSVAVEGPNGGTQPEAIVKKAKKLMREAAKSEGTDAFDQIWCVVDGDYGNRVATARANARAAGVKLAVTTPCFEYWVLLHLEDFRTSQVSCDDVTAQLKGHLSGYDKSEKTCAKLFPKIVENYSIAARRAREGRKQRPSDDPETHNPCSDVYLLVEQFDSQIS